MVDNLTVSRRSFLRRSALALGGIGLSPLFLQGCAFYRSRVERPLRTKYNTIGHVILDIEREHSSGTEAYEFLDELLDRAKGSIQPFERQKRDYKYQALRTLDSIATLLNNNGFEYEKIRLLSQGLKYRRVNCDCYSAIYMAIGEAFNLPIKMVRAPAHTFVRWQPRRYEYLNWETTVGEEKEDAYYISNHNIPRISYGVCAMRSLDVKKNREEILANAYVNSGVAWLKKCNRLNAITRFKEAIRKDPIFESPYYNIGLTYYQIGNMKEAVDWCKQAVALNPNHLRSHAILRSAYGEMKQWRLSEAHFRRVIDIQPDFYSKREERKRIRNNDECKFEFWDGIAASITEKLGLS